MFEFKTDCKEYIEQHLRMTEREGIEDLISYMNECGFYTAPASTKFHGASEGMLAKHSINVMMAALTLAHTWLTKEEFDTMKDSIIICGLLHDLGKAGQFGKPFYVDNILKKGRSEAQPYKTNDDLMSIDHEVASVVEIQKYIELTEDEQRTILWHNGLYGNFKYQIPGKESRLYMIIHFADMWASRVMER